MSRRVAVACGTPEGECNGYHIPADNSKKYFQGHDSHEAAYRCYANYLKRQGYQEHANREFHKPGEPVIVLTKKSRFGLALRAGKADRMMTERGYGGIH